MKTVDQVKSAERAVKLLQDYAEIAKAERKLKTEEGIWQAEVALNEIAALTREEAEKL